MKASFSDCHLVVPHWAMLVIYPLESGAVVVERAVIEPPSGAYTAMVYFPGEGKVMALPVLSPVTVPVFDGLPISVYFAEKLVPTTLIFTCLFVGVAAPVALRRESISNIYPVASSVPLQSGIYR